MDKKVFDAIADHAFLKVKMQYEKESKFDKSKIKTDEEFFEFVEKRIEAVRAHGERYASELAKGLINFYENRKTD